MKTLLFSFAFFLIASTANATIFRLGYTVSPVPGRDFGYNDFGTAQSYAANGDTIQVYQQSNTTGANYNVSKSLTIMGFGHSLNTNTGLQVQNRMDGSVNAISITFSDGSEGSSIQGLNLSSVNFYTGGITITRCRFKDSYINSVFNACGTSSPFLKPTGGGYITIAPYYHDVNNVTINGCFFDRNYSEDINFGGSYNVNNIIVTNNYFNGVVNLKTAINGQINGVFANNILNYKFAHLENVNNWNSNVCTQGIFSYYGNYYTAYYMVSNFDYFLIKNNIFNTEDSVSCPLNAPNSIIQNNVFTNAAVYACIGAGGSNNIYSANMNNVFSAAWNNGFVYNDNQLALGASSVAINAGVRGNNSATNCGVFGGEVDQDYKLSGIPPIPSFYILSTPGINATTNPYNITISVRSNK